MLLTGLGLVLGLVKEEGVPNNTFVTSVDTPDEGERRKEKGEKRQVKRERWKIDQLKGERRQGKRGRRKEKALCVSVVVVTYDSRGQRFDSTEGGIHEIR